MNVHRRGSVRSGVGSLAAMACVAIACGSSTPSGTNIVHGGGGSVAVSTGGIDAGSGSANVDASVNLDANASTDASDAGAIEDASIDSADVAVSSADPNPDATATACPAPAGKLTLYIIPPPTPLDWSSPNGLLESAAASATAGQALVSAGKVALAHEIGHAIWRSIAAIKASRSQAKPAAATNGNRAATASGSSSAISPAS
jgi:hypothetical protein